MSTDFCPACGHTVDKQQLLCPECNARCHFRCLHCWHLHRIDDELCAHTGKGIPSAWKFRPTLKQRLGPWMDRVQRPLREGRLALLVALALSAAWVWFGTPAGIATTSPPGPAVGTQDGRPRIDVVFAIDSIPAIFAVTLDPFIVKGLRIFCQTKVEMSGFHHNRNVRF